MLVVFEVSLTYSSHKIKSISRAWMTVCDKLSKLFLEYSVQFCFNFLACGLNLKVLPFMWNRLKMIVCLRCAELSVIVIVYKIEKKFALPKQTAEKGSATSRWEKPGPFLESPDN